MEELRVDDENILKNLHDLVEHIQNNDLNKEERNEVVKKIIDGLKGLIGKDKNDKLTANGKRVVVQCLSVIVHDSQNFNGLDGKTQTNTNRLDAEGIKGERRTTRGIHSSMVSRLAGALVDKAGRSGPSELNEDAKIEWAYEAELAELIGLCHDMGHCSYGHDGEDAYKNFMKAQGDKSTTVQGFRSAYYGNYEEQQNKQNDVVGDNSTSYGYTFDHGEQSAEAFINLCEANGISIENPIVKEIVQGILLHSRPAFSSSSLACQAVAIADSMSFYQDDSEQMVAFLKISGEKAKLKAKTGGLIDDHFIDDMSVDDRRKAAEAEVIENYKNTGKLQSGQHFEDQKWYISEVIKRVNGNPSLVTEPTKLQAVITSLKNDFGIDISLEGVDTKDPKAVTKCLVAAQNAIEVEFQTKFPFNYKCLTFHKYVAHSLIVNGKIGNNRTEDMTYTKAMMASFTKDISDARKEHSAEFLDTPRPFRETAQVFFETKTFQTIKAQLQQAVALHNAKSTDAPSFRGMKVLSGITKPEEITNEVVLQCLGINLPQGYWDPHSKATAGILDSCTPMQIMTKILSGMNNSLHRFVTREVVKNLDASFLQQGQQGENGYPVIPSFSEKELVYLGKKPMVKGDDGSFHEAEVSEETIKQVLKDELRQGFSLRLEIPNFDYKKILKNVGVTDEQILNAENKIISEIQSSLVDTNKHIKRTMSRANEIKGITNETDLNTKVDEIIKLDAEIEKIEQAFEGNETIIEAIAYFKVKAREAMDNTSYQVKKQQGETNDPGKNASTIDIDEQIINLKNALKDMIASEPELYGMVEEIEKIEKKLRGISVNRGAVVTKVSPEELEAAIEEMNKKESLSIRDSQRLKKYEQLLREKTAPKKEGAQNEQEQQRGKDLS